jgi:hypothetical protein
MKQGTMQFSTDPEFLTLVFATVVAGFFVYFVLYKVLTRLRIRALGLTPGIQRVALSSGGHADVEFKRQKGSGAWWLTIRVKSMQARNYRIPLPIPQEAAFARLDRETFEFGRQAFETGMDWIRQEGTILEIGSRSFRPIRHGHTGFIDQLARGLEKTDWKLACAEGEHALDEITKSRELGFRAFAVLAALGALFMSWVQPVLNHGALLLDPFPSYCVALAFGCVVFVMRFVNLRKRFQKLRRKPPFLAECFWPAFGVGALALIPVQHFDVKLDPSRPKVISAQVVSKRMVQGAYMVKVRKVDGPQAWVVEMSSDDYASATPGKTLVDLKFHSGAFGMEWVERTALDDIDRGIAATPSGQ